MTRTISSSSSSSASSRSTFCLQASVGPESVSIGVGEFRCDTMGDGLEGLPGSSSSTGLTEAVGEIVAGCPSTGLGGAISGERAGTGSSTLRRVVGCASLLNRFHASASPEAILTRPLARGAFFLGERGAVTPVSSSVGTLSDRLGAILRLRAKYPDGRLM